MEYSVTLRLIIPPRFDDALQSVHVHVSERARAAAPRKGYSHSRRVHNGPGYERTPRFERKTTYYLTVRRVVDCAASAGTVTSAAITALFHRAIARNQKAGRLGRTIACVSSFRHRYRDNSALPPPSPPCPTFSRRASTMLSTIMLKKHLTRRTIFRARFLQLEFVTIEKLFFGSAIVHVG